MCVDLSSQLAMVYRFDCRVAAWNVWAFIAFARRQQMISKAQRIDFAFTIT